MRGRPRTISDDPFKLAGSNVVVYVAETSGRSFSNRRNSANGFAVSPESEVVFKPSSSNGVLSLVRAKTRLEKESKQHHFLRKVGFLFSSSAATDSL